ncbi:hypothetical protein BT93_L5112 [Corymbia citriodora subsp. variegata]|uniref:Uncharacterized protein n=1 Tax=Corymbia citriodora subsp. variegata TaxID=360336 RepID=A0A8T0CWY2_CORYI|nr:hypothetical protein BT93_L5112 [Corymbia citriodora subsp. variegata]
MAFDKSFSSGHMLLSPEKVLFRILIQGDVHEREFVDSSLKGGESYRWKWIMFVSILAEASASCGQTHVLDRVGGRVLVESPVQQSELGRASRQLPSRLVCVINNYPL